MNKNYDYKKLCPFKWFVRQNFPFLDYDFDQITNWQLFQKLGEKINEIIESQNNLGQEMEQLVSAFNSLKDYVDDYFENLDVQEEINKKLDEMAESGDLAEIIAQYLNSQVMFCFDTVADMVACETFQNGSYARTLGFHSINDRGTGKYLIRTIQNTDVVDNMFKFAITNDNTLIAELLVEDTISPEQIGCYGDGIHDDTTIFENLLTYLQDKNITLIGSGNYYFTGHQVNFGNINVSMPSAKIISDYGIKIVAYNKQLDLPSVYSEANQNIGIEIHNSYQNKIIINNIKGFETGLKLTADDSGCCYNILEILEIRNCLNGIVLENTSSGWVNENTFIKGRIFNESQFVTNNASNIKLISLLGNSSHSINNNYFLNTCIEGNEGTNNGIKIKLNYANYNIFESLRYEGTNPKVDSENSNYNVLNYGYNVGGIEFIHDTLPINMNDSAYINKTAGSIAGYWKDIQMSDNSYPILKARNTAGNVLLQLFNHGLVGYDGNNNKNIEYSSDGLYGFYENVPFKMIRPFGTNCMIPNCDGINHMLFISPTEQASTACRLWVYNNHLYGKFGNPSTPTDGTIIV